LTRFGFAIDIAAPPERVFDLWADLDRLTDWTVGLTKVTQATGDGDQTGTNYTLWFGSLDQRVEVLAADRPNYHRTRAKFGTIKIETSVTFEDIGGATRMRESIMAKGIKARIWATVLAAGSFRGSFRGELERFAQVVERDELRRPIAVMVPREELLEDQQITRSPERAVS
jgi:uncharacterized protein YndB with AHSA1/START domain